MKFRIILTSLLILACCVAVKADEQAMPDGSWELGADQGICGLLQG